MTPIGNAKYRNAWNLTRAPELKSIVAPTRLVQDRLKVLRNAFAKTVTDPEFKAELR